MILGKKIGLIDITDELKELLNATATIKGVTYDWENNTINIEVYFIEEGKTGKHSRSFEFENPTGGDYSTVNVLGLINGHDILKQFSNQSAKTTRLDKFNSRDVNPLNKTKSKWEIFINWLKNLIRKW